jgi:hypothetical protein
MADLDDEALQAGYDAGREGWPEPGDNHSYAFWCGWRNGASDAGHKPIDEAQRAVVRDYVARATA